MKKIRIVAILLISLMIMCFAAGCSNKSDNKNGGSSYGDDIVYDSISGLEPETKRNIIIAVVVYVVSGIIWGNVCSSMAEKCGSEGKRAFVKGFFLNVIGLALVVMDCFESIQYTINKLKEENEKEKM
jgi:hypothetical protein